MTEKEITSRLTTFMEFNNKSSCCHAETVAFNAQTPLGFIPLVRCMKCEKSSGPMVAYEDEKNAPIPNFNPVKNLDHFNIVQEKIKSDPKLSEKFVREYTFLSMDEEAKSKALFSHLYLCGWALCNALDNPT